MNSWQVSSMDVTSPEQRPTPKLRPSSLCFTKNEPSPASFSFRNSPREEEVLTLRSAMSKKRKQAFADPQDDDDCGPTPCKLFAVDCGVESEVMENGYFKDETVHQDVDREAVKRRTAEAEQINHEDEDWLIQALVSPGFNIPGRTPDTPGGGFPRMVKRRLTPATTPSSPMTPIMFWY